MAHRFTSGLVGVAMIAAPLAFPEAAPAHVPEAAAAVDGNRLAAANLGFAALETADAQQPYVDCEAGSYIVTTRHRARGSVPAKTTTSGHEFVDLDNTGDMAIDYAVYGFPSGSSKRKKLGSGVLDRHEADRVIDRRFAVKTLPMHGVVVVVRSSFGGEWLEQDDCPTR